MQIKEQVGRYMKNAAYILNGLAQAGYTVSGGTNSPYVWLKTPDEMTSWDFFDCLNALSAAGLAVTAVGCGNGAYNAGVALAAVGTAQPLLLTAALNVILVGLGAGVVSACTNIAMKVKLDETGEEYAFAFPYSFKQFFTAEDPALQQEILDFYDSGAWVAPIHDHHDC